MPVVSFAFGSLGDIAAILQLAWNLRTVLDGAANASNELRILIADLDEFTRALQEVQGVVERQTGDLRPDIVNGIAHALGICHDVLSSIQSRILTFESRMTRAKGVAVWRQYWSIATWSILGGRAEIDAARERLTEQVRVMQLYLSVSQRHVSPYSETIDQQGTTLARVFSVVQDIQSRFDTGLPTFRFYDAKTRSYYEPFARTSLQRLWDIRRAIQKKPLRALRWNGTRETAFHGTSRYE
ncbi:hypothetical protein AURDEDRAFT_173572 [Auricularia subglabra TFB-10046 SS5]|nr:hypothetical protein AURDEDRAFT_173572 [Auricularia subglabra TFB-10046 SS5]